jgi:NADPH:quinone reductase-like Zn-dependent oxidoreductase
MKAIRVHAFGGPEVLQLDQTEAPQIKAGEVLVRIGAAGVNPVDCKIRQGGFPKITQAQLPVTLGRDICGVIEQSEARGEAQGKAYRPGDEVYALLDWTLGGYAQFVAIPASLCVPKPQRLSVIEAGAVPLAALTAWQGLFDYGALKEGQRVLIHAGAGGVGHFAIQFARERGARVFATASAQHLDFVRELGAEVAIDYHTQRFEDQLRELDLVYDLVGGETRARSFSVLKPGGALVSTVGQPDEREADKHQVHAKGYMAQPNRRQLEEISRLIDAGRVHPKVTRSFALEQAAEAHRFLEQEHPAGKVVLTVES